MVFKVYISLYTCTHVMTCCADNKGIHSLHSKRQMSMDSRKEKEKEKSICWKYFDKQKSEGIQGCVDVPLSGLLERQECTTTMGDKFPVSFIWTGVWHVPSVNTLQSLIPYASKTSTIGRKSNTCSSKCFDYTVTTHHDKVCKLALVLFY